MLTLAAAFPRTAGPREAPQAMAQRSAVVGLLVTFEFDQTAPTTDLIGILFSNVAADLRQAPKSQFGDGVVAKFTFSGRDYPKPNSHISYSQRVRDRTFLDCRYIRVVNTGNNPWSGGSPSAMQTGKVKFFNETKGFGMMANGVIGNVVGASAVLGATVSR